MKEDWKKCKLGEVCNISSSKRIFAEEYTTDGIPFYRGKEIIEKRNKITISSELFISYERFEEIKTKFSIPKIGDILLTSVGTIGVPWLVNEENFYFNILARAMALTKQTPRLNISVLTGCFNFRRN